MLLKNGMQLNAHGTHMEKHAWEEYTKEKERTNGQIQVQGQACRWQVSPQPSLCSQAAPALPATPSSGPPGHVHAMHESHHWCDTLREAEREKGAYNPMGVPEHYIMHACMGRHNHITCMHQVAPSSCTHACMDREHTTCTLRYTSVRTGDCMRTTICT